MGDPLRFEVRPELDEPALLLAFEGWNDAGESATSAAHYFSDAMRGAPLAEIDPEEFYDFTVNRPIVSLDAGGVRQIGWPTTRFRYGSLGPERPLIVGVGPEPHLRWRGYCDHVLRLVAECRVRRVVLLGAFLADVLYSLPVRVSGFSSDPALMDGLRVQPSGYEGPTGILGVLAGLLRETDCEVVSLWAGLPHYISAAPNPRGTLALIQKTCEYLDARTDETALQKSAAEFEQRISALVASDPSLTEYVKELKRREFAQ